MSPSTLEKPSKVLAKLSHSHQQVIIISYNINFFQAYEAKPEDRTLLQLTEQADKTFEFKEIGEGVDVTYNNKLKAVSDVNLIYPPSHL